MISGELWWLAVSPTGAAAIQSRMAGVQFPPVTGSARGALQLRLATEIDALPVDPFVRIGIDGVDGAGKTVFADELATALRTLGRTVVRASIDGFHHPRALRYLRGRDDPEGFYRDSYDLAALHRELLDPFGPGGDGWHRPRVFDVTTDVPDVAEQVYAPPDTILVVDGVFLHQPRVRCWSWSLWLQVERSTSLQRCVDRDGIGSPDPSAASNRRYVEGQQFYLQEVAPQERATHIIDNNDLSAPVLLR